MAATRDKTTTTDAAMAKAVAAIAGGGGRFARRCTRDQMPGTEIRLESDGGQHIGNIYLSCHVDEYPDVVQFGTIPYYRVSRGNGPELALYHERPDWRMAGEVDRVPAGPLLPPRRSIEDD